MWRRRPFERYPGDAVTSAARPLRAVPERRTAPKAPSHLSKPSQAFWREVTRDYELEPHHLLTLQAACEARDRMDQARAAIEKDGPYAEGRFGPKAHPAIAVERDSRLAMVRCLRELGLDLEAPAQSRPPTRWRD